MPSNWTHTGTPGSATTTRRACHIASHVSCRIYLGIRPVECLRVCVFPKSPHLRVVRQFPSLMYLYGGSGVSCALQDKGAVRWRVSGNVMFSWMSNHVHACSVPSPETPRGSWKMAPRCAKWGHRCAALLSAFAAFAARQAAPVAASLSAPPTGAPRP